MRDAEDVTFAGPGFDRAAHLRGDADALRDLGQAPQARFLALWQGKPLLRASPDAARLAWLEPDAAFLREYGGERVFLGLEESAGRFAVDVSAWEDPQADAAALGQFVDPTRNRHPSFAPETAFLELRGVLPSLDPVEAGFAATAKSLLGWHRTHGFCANCGAASAISCGGWQRICPACSTTHFPRTDPAVIMLITHGNSVLLGRNAVWPKGMFSLLAGFVEPGESIENAVRRETAEETAIPVGQVEYLASQPWPFPASLMIGCRGEALARDIRIDPVELEAARWASREEVLAALAGENPDFRPARKGAIARFLLERWLADRLD